MKAPAFQLYAKDVYTGTSDLSAAEFGAYMRGLCWSWDNGPLPLDPTRRARVLLLSAEEFAAIWPAIAHLWRETGMGWANDRLERARAELSSYQDSKAQSGQAGARKRWGKSRTDSTPIVSPLGVPSPTDSTPIDSPLANGMANDSSASASASASAISDLPSALSLSLSGASERDELGRVEIDGIAYGTGRRYGTPLHADHRRCVPEASEACGRGLCVPAYLIGQWRAQVGGDDPAEAEGVIRAFVRETVARLPAGPIGDEPLRFWRAAWSARHGSQAPAEARPPTMGKGDATKAAVMRAVEARRRAQEAPS